MVPTNDFFKVRIESSDWAGAPNAEEGVREGIVEAISEKATYYGMNTYAFDSSLMNEELLKDVYEHYKTYVGKKVYWPERSESGALIVEGQTTYAFIKWSSVMAIKESDEA